MSYPLLVFSIHKIYNRTGIGAIIVPAAIGVYYSVIVETRNLLIYIYLLQTPLSYRHLSLTDASL